MNVGRPYSAVAVAAGAGAPFAKRRQGERDPRLVRQVSHFGERDALLNLRSAGGPDHEIDVPPGLVLALGDHRGNSNDGRKFGLIDERELFGRAVAIYYRRGEGFTWMPL